MARTFTLIKAETLSSDSATFTFSNIPQNFSHLLVKISPRSSTGTGTSRALQMIINKDETNQVGTAGFDKYRQRYFRVNDSGVADAGAFTSTTGLRYYFYGLPVGGTASAFGTSEIFIANYNKNSYKTIHGESFAEGLVSTFTGTAGMSITAALWFSTQAVTNLTFNSDQGNLVSGSTFYLYGIDSTRATGGTITHDSEYTYHTFTSTGTFSALEKINNVDYLVVAGGGGGSGQWYYQQGGGGAGGLRSTVTSTGGGAAIEPKISFAAGNSYAVTIGAGGAGATGPVGGAASTHIGAKGTNSSISSTVISLGGGGGAGSDGNPTSGGSGGGAGESTGAAGTVGQGYAGGNGNGGGGWSVGGGGGGAGGVGGNGTNPTPGSGGVGVEIAAFATPTGTGANSGYYAGGGGGASYDSLSVGAGGAGGGGAGSSTSNGIAGTANTGGGGGAGSKYFSTFYSGGSGGSGLVIIRYKTNE